MRSLTMSDHATHRLRLNRVPNTRQLPALIVREIMVMIVCVKIWLHVSAHNLHQRIMPVMPLAVTLVLLVPAEHAERHIARTLCSSKLVADGSRLTRT